LKKENLCDGHSLKTELENWSAIKTSNPNR